VDETENPASSHGISQRAALPAHEREIEATLGSFSRTFGRSPFQKQLFTAKGRNDSSSPVLEDFRHPSGNMATGHCIGFLSGRGALGRCLRHPALGLIH
jgi:hypothetical protein